MHYNYIVVIKKQITIRLDEGAIDYFKSISGDVGIPYQSLINLYLRDCAASHPFFICATVPHHIANSTSIGARRQQLRKRLPRRYRQDNRLTLSFRTVLVAGLYGVASGCCGIRRLSGRISVNGLVAPALLTWTRV
ncbi:MAG: hypothetical protein ACREPY_15055 [Rhodanobacteraceae bacterium]